VTGENTSCDKIFCLLKYLYLESLILPDDLKYDIIVLVGTLTNTPQPFEKLVFHSQTIPSFESINTLKKNLQIPKAKVLIICDNLPTEAYTNLIKDLANTNGGEDNQLYLIICHPQFLPQLSINTNQLFIGKHLPTTGDITLTKCDLNLDHDPNDCIWVFFADDITPQSLEVTNTEIFNIPTTDVWSPLSTRGNILLNLIPDL
jgi:hypothetical protein